MGWMLAHHDDEPFQDIEGIWIGERSLQIFLQ